MRDVFQIGEIAAITKGKLIGNGSLKVAHIATDSRSISRSKLVIFVAISGEHHNGNDYLDEVYEKGIRCILTDQTPAELYPDVSYCIVKDALSALQLLAAHKRSSFQGQLVAITGSNGKTIVKEWLYQLLQRKSKVIRSPRSYNSQLGVPLSVWQLDDTYDIGIIEAGISLPGEMEKLERIVRPDIGILTNLGTAHNENFESDSQKLREKLNLFKDCNKLIFNAEVQVDTKNIQVFLDKYSFEKIDWSLNGDAKYTYRLLDDDPENVKIELKNHGSNVMFELPYSDSASVENIIHVITCLLELNMRPEEISDGLKDLEPVEMRLETLNGIYNSTLVNDVYNSDLAGLTVALNVLDQQKKHARKVIILSDMFQSGIAGLDLYKEVASMLKFRNIEQIFCVGEAMSEFKEVFPENSRFFADTKSFIEQFNAREIENAAVLIKGARKFHFEEITKLLQLQYHKTVLEINLNELVQNLNYFRSLLKPRTRLMIMVKALSYGSGGDEIAAFLQHEKVDYLAVAFPDEGANLRRAGLKLPIMVMNTDTDDYRSLLENDLEPEIFSREGLTKFIRQCKYMGRTGYPVHIKLDTGMHRLGFEEDDIDWLIEKLAKEELVIKSIFTHLAGSEDPLLDDYSKEQVSKFEKMSERLMQFSGNNVIRHVLNSAGIERFPEFQFDMVRIGIGLYGQGISKNLATVSTFKTVISQIRNVKAGDTIGYNRKGKVLKDARIATIPVGYADGIDRRLGNGNFSFYLNGQRVPTIGNVCMDMTMIDISGIDATIGDKVELFGKNLSVVEMADKLETIVYEILTSIPERVKRVYIRE